MYAQVHNSVVVSVVSRSVLGSMSNGRVRQIDRVLVANTVTKQGSSHPILPQPEQLMGREARMMQDREGGLQ
jgi:hypothetical protein